MNNKHSILIVDDEAIVRDSLSKWFTEDGFTIGTAENAPSALRQLQTRKWDIILLDIRPVSYLADFFVICSGDSERQVKAIIESIAETLRGEGRRPVHSEGSSPSGWVLLDYGDLVVHVFAPQTRDYYQIEKLWADATPELRIQ